MSIYYAIFISFHFFYYINNPGHEFTFENLPCEGFWSLTHAEIAKDEDCKLRKQVAFGTLLYSVEKKLNEGDITNEETSNIFNNVYNKLKNTDAKWIPYLHLADDVLYQQISCMKSVLNDTEIEKIIHKLLKEHRSDTVCNIKDLDDHRLRYFFGGRYRKMKISESQKLSQSIHRFYIEHCVNNTYVSALYELATYSQLVKDNPTDAIQYYIKILDFDSNLNNLPLSDFIKSKGYDIKREIIREENPFIIYYYYKNNIIAKSIKMLLSLYLKTNQPSKALNLIDRYGKYQSLFWLKEVKPLIETYSKDKHLDFQRKLDETIWNAIRDAP